jgi:hypothetical protein
VTLGMEGVHDEEGVGEEVRFACHAIRTKGAGEVVDDGTWGLDPPSDHGREDVVSALATWNAMEAITNRVCAPDTHYSTCEALLPILRVIFRTFCASSTTFFFLCVVGEIRVFGAMSNLWFRVEASSLPKPRSGHVYATLYQKRSLFANRRLLELHGDQVVGPDRR